MTDEADDETAYDMLGGEAMVRKITKEFFDVMETEPEFAKLRGMHSADLTAIRQIMFEYLSGWLGGPSLYVQRKERNCIMSAHRAYTIGAAERDEWAACMHKALRRAGVPEKMAGLLDQAFLNFAQGFVNA